MELPKQVRQHFIDEYLAATGRKVVVPAEMLDWLRPQTQHPLWQRFFTRDDASAAQAWREDQVRRFISDLRITVHAVIREPAACRVRIEERALPAAFSPVATRAAGGGYILTDPTDPAHIAEIARQAGVSLRSWLNRYGGAVKMNGHDLSAVETLARMLTPAAHVFEEEEDAAA